MKFKAVVWDLDGTLLNTIDDLRNAANYALTAHGLPTRTTEEMKMFVGRGIHYMLTCAVPGGEENPLFEAVKATFMPYYEVHCQDETAPYDGIPKALAALREAGIKMAVVTNKVQFAADELVSRLFPDIDIVIGDSPAVKRKPAPDGVYLALKKMGVSQSDAAYIGDSDVDYATAQNAALPCLSVLWGFRTKEQLTEVGANTFFDTPADLVNYILQSVEMENREPQGTPLQKNGEEAKS